MCVFLLPNTDRLQVIEHYVSYFTPMVKSLAAPHRFNNGGSFGNINLVRPANFYWGVLAWHEHERSFIYVFRVTIPPLLLRFFDYNLNLWHDLFLAIYDNGLVFSIWINLKINISFLKMISHICQVYLCGYLSLLGCSIVCMVNHVYHFNCFVCFPISLCNYYLYLWLITSQKPQKCDKNQGSTPVHYHKCVFNRYIFKSCELGVIY